MKKSKISNHKNGCKMKKISLVCTKLRSFINVYSFSTTFVSLFEFLKIAFWFHFFENGPFTVNIQVKL